MQKNLLAAATHKHTVPWPPGSCFPDFPCVCIPATPGSQYSQKQYDIVTLKGLSQRLSSRSAFSFRTGYTSHTQIQVTCAERFRCPSRCHLAAALLRVLTKAQVPSLRWILLGRNQAASFHLSPLAQV